MLYKNLSSPTNSAEDPLFQYVTRRIRRLPEKQVIGGLLQSFLALFDLRRVSLFIAPEEPVRRIVLVDARGDQATKLQQRADDLGWFEAEPSNNSWLFNVLKGRTPIHFDRDPAGTPGVWSQENILELDDTWKLVSLPNTSMIAIPFPPKEEQRFALGLLTAEYRSEAIDNAALLRLARMCREMQDTIWSSWETRHLLKRQRQFKSAMAIASAHARATSTRGGLQALAVGLRKQLDADYVDICELLPGNPSTSESRFFRVVKSDRLPATIVPHPDSFICSFRHQATQVERGRRLVSNRSELNPVVPGMKESTTFTTSVGCRCSGGLAVSTEVILRLEEEEAPKVLIRKLKALEGQGLATVQDLNHLLSDQLRDQKTVDKRWINRTVELAAEIGLYPASGVVTIAFRRRRILSFTELHLIDTVSELASSTIAAMKERQDVAESCRTYAQTRGWQDFTGARMCGSGRRRQCTSSGSAGQSCGDISGIATISRNLNSAI